MIIINWNLYPSSLFSDSLFNLGAHLDYQGFTT